MSGTRRADPARARRGFTLIELLVVLAILAGGIALIMPVVLAPRGPGNLERAAESVAERLKSQRAAAMLGNRVVRVTTEDLALPAGLRFSSPPDGIRFSPDGFSHGGRIEITDGAATRRVVVEPFTGRVRRD